MNCPAVRERLSAHAAGRLQGAERDEVAAHLAGCADCRQAAAVETQLSAALDRLPRHRAPDALRQRLQALVAKGPASEAPGEAETPPAAAPADERSAGETLATPAASAAPRSRPPRRWTWAAPFVSACAAAALALVVARTTAPPPAPVVASADMVAEAVNDHLRVIDSSHPVEIESGGIHQVKPWFTGRLDFAPRVAFSGDADFPLLGGSVGYFRDRKAAVMVFKRRLHTITLLVFPDGGLGWPTAGLTRLGTLSVAHESSRGFSVLLWRDHGLGYALISDVNAQDLEMLASRLNID